MELVAKGAQDIYLTGNPNVTYFKSVFKRDASCNKLISKFLKPSKS